MSGVIGLSFLVLALGCGSAISVNNGSNATTAPKPDDPNIRRVLVKQTKTFNDLEITISEIAVEPNKVTVRMNVRNTANDIRSFYPNQHSVVIGSQQLDASPLNNGTQVSGELNAGIERSDSIEFENKGVAIDPGRVDLVGLRLGDILSEKPFRTVAVNWDIPLPH